MINPCATISRHCHKQWQLTSMTPPHPSLITPQRWPIQLDEAIRQYNYHILPMMPASSPHHKQHSYQPQTPYWTHSTQQSPMLSCSHGTALIPCDKTTRMPYPNDHRCHHHCWQWQSTLAPSANCITKWWQLSCPLPMNPLLFTWQRLLIWSVSSNGWPKCHHLQWMPSNFQNHAWCNWQWPTPSVILLPQSNSPLPAQKWPCSKNPSG